MEPGIPIKDGIGTATMDYTVLEMEVALGDTVEGGIKLKGWVWCTSSTMDREGWVPEENLQMLNK